MKTAVAESISLAMMIGKHASVGTAGINTLLVRLASVSNLISDLETTLAKTDREKFSVKESSETLGKYEEIMDRHSELANQFFQLRFALNMIAGKSLVLKNAMKSGEIHELTRNLAQLEQSFKALENVRTEIENA